jgi:ribonuclease E
VRSVSSVALQLLRAIEEMLIKGATHNLIVRTRAEVALYVLNHKRAHLRALEERFRVTLTVSADPTVTGQQSYVVDRGEQVHTVEAAKSIAAAHPIPLPTVDEEDEFIADEAEEDIVEAQGHEQEAAVPAQADEEAPRRDSEREGGPRRRRRRGRGGRGRGGEPREGAPAFTHDTVPEHAVTHEDHDAGAPEEEGFSPPQPRPEGGQPGESDRDGVRRRRRRGRRGGRRNRPHNGEAPFRSAENGVEPELQHAVEDLDRPPSYDSTPAASYAPPMEQRPAPAAMEPPAVPANAQEPPRRRSTIREPAPFASERAPVPSSPAAPSTPVISSTGPEEPATPKRGWWGKRLLGDKS